MGKTVIQIDPPEKRAIGLMPPNPKGRVES